MEVGANKGTLSQPLFGALPDDFFEAQEPLCLRKGPLSPELTRAAMQCPCAHGGPRNLCHPILDD